MKPLFIVCTVVLASCGTAFGQDSYRCLDDGLDLDLIHSDPEAFYISMDMDPRGNLYVGGRDAVYLFEANGEGGFKPRRTITTLPEHTWAYSLQVAGDDLYLLTVTALYRLPNVIRDPGKVTFERLVWGIPLGHIHQGFHGMKMGPDGGVYLAFGDPQPGPFRRKTNPGHVWHWTFLSGPDAKKTPWTGVGGVVRYDPKSHLLTTISRGFRNICDLDFDEYWNLFGNDNDQEGSALHTFGRLTHVTEGSHYQWSRGWLQAKEPYRNDLIQTIDPALGRFVPFGTCYYNEDHLGDAYKRSLVVARWGSRELGQFPLRVRGASFTSSQKPLLVGKDTARPVAVFTGNDGRLFASICFMQRNEASPVKRTDLVVISNPNRDLKPHAIDPSTAGINTLLDEIDSPSWKRRFNAHREIVSRGMRDDEQVHERFLKATVGSPPWHSLAWLVGRNEDEQVVATLSQALSSNDGRAASTAADILRRFHQLGPSQVKSLLASESPIAQLAGLRAADESDLGESISGLATSSDSLVRQAAQRWIGRHTAWPELEQQFDSGDLPSRRVALAAAMWKWNDQVENGAIPDGIKLSAAAEKHLSGFHYVDDPKSNLKTESERHGFRVGGLPMMDWWKQTASSDPDAPEIRVIGHMISQAIYDTDDAHRKTAAVFANTLGMDDLASRVPGLVQTRTIKADIAKGAKLSANKEMPQAYQEIDWTSAWRKGDVKTGAALFKKRCIACHDSGQGGGVIGPSLAGVAKRFTPLYLAQSVAAPSKDVSPNFQAWSIFTEDGKVLLGFLSGEDENRITLQMMDGSLKAIDKSHIEEKAPSKTSLMPVGLISGPDELKHIVRYLMTLKSPSSSSSPPATEEKTGDPTALTVQRTVDPVRANSFSFAPTEAKFVRVDVLKSSEGKPCIDELEIFSGDSPKNLALHSTGAKATASSLLRGYEEKHQIEFLNDGKYGNARSWIPAEITGWAQIELPKPMKIDRVVISRDRGGQITRRVPVSFDILVSVDGEEWKTVKEVRQPKTAAQASISESVAPVVADDEDGFASIFDGKTLDQWDHRKGAWEVLDNTISCTGVEKTRNWIIWRGGTPADFVLRLDFKYEAGNSGVQVRSDDQGNHQVYGYQVEIAPQNKMGLWHHSLLAKEDPAHDARFFMATAGQEVAITTDGGKTVKQVAAKEEIVAHYRQDDWNSMEIIAEGNTLTQKINGVVFSKVTDDDKRMSRRKGVIALQDHGKGCRVAFRNIRIKELAGDEKARPRRAPAPEPTTGTSSAKPSRPNIVLIMADDMGYADVERFGNANIPTPSLNRLCDEGVRFTDAYVTAPICVSSRMGLMSGCYQQRFGVYGNFNAPSQQKLALRATVMPRPFQQNGYRTGLVGKWHLSGNGVDDWQLPGPLTRGFDECVAITGGGSSFWPGARIIRQEEFEKSPVYLTDLWGTEASAFIERNAKRPFFLYLAFNAVHAPLHALDEDIAPFADRIKDPNRRIYAGMQRAMDRAVGRVLNELDKQEIADNTIVIFLNDNGGGGSTDQYASHSRNYANNSPFRGHKFDVFEGGIRVPMIMRWPGRLQAGSVYSKMVSSADIYRTVVSAAELKMPSEKFDSVNLLPFLTGNQKGEPHDWLCWQNRSRLPTSDGGLYSPRSREHNCAIRKGNWKLVRLNEEIDSNGRPPAWQLYDLASDVGEQHDVAAKHPEVVRELGQLFNAWRADMHPSISARARRETRRPERD